MEIGIDIVEIRRIKRVMKKPEIYSRIFNEDEIVDMPESMAGKFAAKEAFFKAIGGDKIDWLNVKVLKEKSGKPYIETYLKDNVKVSISHDGEYATAVVLVEK